MSGFVPRNFIPTENGDIQWVITSREAVANNQIIRIYSDNATLRSQLPFIIRAPKFLKYIDSLDFSSLNIKSIRVDNATWFCAPSAIAPEKLGFLYLMVEATDRRTNKPVPGVVFLRGGAVAVLIVVRINNKPYVILTKQIRVPTGGYVLEIPAGMMDAKANFAGVAMNEIAEETGLNPPNLDQLVTLGNPILPSPGGCDEEIQLFFWETTISQEKAVELEHKIHGNKDEHEAIQLVFVPLEDFEKLLCSTISDVKAICAYMRARELIYK